MARETPTGLLSSKPKTVKAGTLQIIHHQLRDLLVCPQVAGVVSYIDGQRIVEHDLYNSAPPRTMASLEFTPNCLSSYAIPDSDDFILAAGGQDAELYLGRHTSSSASPSMEAVEFDISGPSTRPSTSSSSLLSNTSPRIYDSDARMSPADYRRPSSGSGPGPRHTRTVWTDVHKHIGLSINNSVVFAPPSTLSSFSSSTNRSPGSGVSLDVHVGKAAESAAEPKLLVSNNDASVSFFDVAVRRYADAGTDTEASASASMNTNLHRLSPAGTVRFDVAVNHSSISPDGRTLLSVGDSSAVWLHALPDSIRSGASLRTHTGTSSGGSGSTLSQLLAGSSPSRYTSTSSYSNSGSPGGSGSSSSLTPILTLRLPSAPAGYTALGSIPAAFATSFSADGTKFAVGSQDGILAVWDVRSSKALKVFEPDQVPVGWGGDVNMREGGSGSGNGRSSGWLRDVGGDGGSGNRDAYGRRTRYRARTRQLGASYNPSPAWGVRNIKFGKSRGTELLVFTEHANNFHAIDARTFEYHEMHSMPDPPRAPARSAGGPSNPGAGPGTGSDGSAPTSADATNAITSLTPSTGTTTSPLARSRATASTSTSVSTLGTTAASLAPPSRAMFNPAQPAEPAEPSTGSSSGSSSSSEDSDAGDNSTGTGNSSGWFRVPPPGSGQALVFRPGIPGMAPTVTAISAVHAESTRNPAVEPLFVSGSAATSADTPAAAGTANPTTTPTATATRTRRWSESAAADEDSDVDMRSTRDEDEDEEEIEEDQDANVQRDGDGHIYPALVRISPSSSEDRQYGVRDIDDSDPRTRRSPVDFSGPDMDNRSPSPIDADPEDWAARLAEARTRRLVVAQEAREREMRREEEEDFLRQYEAEYRRQEEEEERRQRAEGREPNRVARAPTRVPVPVPVPMTAQGENQDSEAVSVEELIRQSEDRRARRVMQARERDLAQALRESEREADQTRAAERARETERETQTTTGADPGYIIGGAFDRWLNDPAPWEEEEEGTPGAGSSAGTGAVRMTPAAPLRAAQVAVPRAAVSIPRAGASAGMVVTTEGRQMPMEEYVRLHPAYFISSGSRSDGVSIGPNVRTFGAIAATAQPSLSPIPNPLRAAVHATISRRAPIHNPSAAARARRWARAEAEALGGAPSAVDIAGMCFDPRGEHLYVASEDAIAEWSVNGAGGGRWWESSSGYDGEGWGSGILT